MKRSCKTENVNMVLKRESYSEKFREPRKVDEMLEKIVE